MEKCYSTDLSDAEWECLRLHLPAANKRGRPRTHDTREILNAVYYVLKSGCPWRLLPKDFPPWETVYWWFSRWRIDGTFERLNAELREVLRVRSGRTRSRERRYRRLLGEAKTTGVGGEERGYEGNKKVRGRERHLLVDTEEGWSSKPRCTQRQGARPGRPEAPPAGVGADRALAPEAPLARGRIRGKGQAVGREEDMGLSVEVVCKPPKPVPEEVAKIWAEEWAKEGKRRWTGGSSCRAARLRSFTSSMGG